MSYIALLWPMFALPCMSPQPDVFLCFRFGEQRSLPQQRLSAGDRPGELGSPSLAEDPLRCLSCLRGFARGDLPDQVHKSGAQHLAG